MTRAAVAAAIVVSCIAGAAAQAPGAGKLAPAPPGPMAQGAALLTIMAAEDSRLPLPDDLHTPAIDTLRVKQMEDLRTLLELARSVDPLIQRRAIRALGRFERRDVIPDLLQYLALGPATETATAIAQAFRGDPLPNDRDGEQVGAAFDALTQVGVIPMDQRKWPGPIGPVSRAIGALPYEGAEQVQAAYRFLFTALRSVDRLPELRALVVPHITRGIESLTRRHARLARPDDDMIVELRSIAMARRREYQSVARRNALEALMAAGGLDAETLRMAAGVGTIEEDTALVEMRRLAAVALGGAGTPVVDTERTELLTTLLQDRAARVRMEAIRSWARQESRTSGCQRLLDALKDPVVNVVLVAIDALGDACRDDVNVTDRLTVEAGPPPPNEWHRASHALVALAKRAAGRVFIPLLAGHVQHVTWQVRMYAARAAAITNEVSALERLAMDSEDNVREAALPALHRLKGNDVEPYLVAACGRRDYQLLRTAAVEAKSTAATPQIAGALLDAVTRVTADKKETSRDTRLALLDALRLQGTPDQAGALVPLLRDFDIPVARNAAALLQEWTGKPQEIAPQLLARPPLPLDVELMEARDTPARITLASGLKIVVTLHPEVAPLASVRFLRLVKAGYFDGLTFHRIVPNFIVQGGSPGANEYVGDALYGRDEIDLSSNTYGSVGLSTRGRDTGDAQFYINLADNPRLDFEYTVFGTAAAPRLDEILEGDRIVKITFEKETTGKAAQERPAAADVGYAGAQTWPHPTASVLSQLMPARTGCCAARKSSRSRRRSSISCSTSPHGSRRWSRRTSSSRRSGPMSQSPTTR